MDPRTSLVWEGLEDELDREYLEELSALQVELLALQAHVIQAGERVIVVFEGRDAAGKGGAILRFTQHLRPRHSRVVALAKPTDTEHGQWYFQRYLRRFPAPGEIVFFDRSWYNRAVVEPVMGFCTPDEYERFMEDVVLLEQMWTRDGIRLFKLWFSIDRDEQSRRLEARRENPLKQWKLSTVDLEAQRQWDLYTRHKEAMFARTASERAPWAVVDGNDKKTARLEAMRYFISGFDYPGKGRSGATLAVDPERVRVLTGPSERRRRADRRSP